MTQKNCEYFQELASAALDGELDGRELGDLRRHLHGCQECRRFSDQCQSLNLLLETGGEQPAVAEVNGLPTEIASGEMGKRTFAAPQLTRPSRGVPVDQKWSANIRWLSVATLMVVALGVGLAVRNSPTRSAEKSVAPLVSQLAENIEASEDQQSLLRILQMDLRTMRIEIQQPGIDEAARQVLAQRINVLLGKANEIERTQVAFKGDIP